MAERDGDITKLTSGLQEAQRLAIDREQELRRYDEALAEAQQLVAERDGDITKLTSSSLWQKLVFFNGDSREIARV